MTEDEADEWFSTHDTSEVPGEWEPGDGAPPAFEYVNVRIFSAEADELRRRAEAMSAAPETYARLVLNRHLLDEPPLA